MEWNLWRGKRLDLKFARISSRHALYGRRSVQSSLDLKIENERISKRYRRQISFYKYGKLYELGAVKTHHIKLHGNTHTWRPINFIKTNFYKNRHKWRRSAHNRRASRRAKRLQGAKNRSLRFKTCHVSNWQQSKWINRLLWICSGMHGKL